ncbi:MAG TPA: tetratricopeptide repeat protein [Sandaracinaceae bacterium]
MRELATAFLIVLWASAAHAQLPDPPPAPTDADVARARALFVEGVQHAQDRRWDEALDAFLRSYATSGSPAALFNVGSALRELGRYREARDAFDRLLEDPALDDDTRARAEELRTETAARVARVRLEGVPPGEARVTGAGAPRETPERPIELELDPGARALGVELPGYAPWRWSGTLAPGAELVLDASLSSLSAGDPLPWFLGAAGIVIAGVIVALVVADAEAQLDPRTPLSIALP